jgi:hypothetical protein
MREKKQYREKEKRERRKLAYWDLFISFLFKNKRKH